MTFRPVLWQDITYSEDADHLRQEINARMRLLTLSLSAPLTITSASTTYSIPEAGTLFEGDTTTAGFTVTLPSAANRLGRLLIVTNTGANILTVSPTGSEKINGVAASIALTTLNESRILVAVSSDDWRAV